MLIHFLGGVLCYGDSEPGGGGGLLIKICRND